MNSSFHLLAGWLIDGTGSPVRRDMLMEVRDGVIRSLKRARPGGIGPDPNPFLDFSRCTVLPGLLDCHVHLTMSGTNDEDVRRRQLSYSYDKAKAAIIEHLGLHLAHGIVAVRDGGDSAAHSLRYRDEHLAEVKLPIKVRAAGRAWRAHGRYGRLIGSPPPHGCSLAQAIAHQGKGTDHIKVINSGLNSLTRYGKETLPQFSPEDLEAAVEISRRIGMKAMIHANGSLPVRQAVDANCTSIEHGFFMGKGNIERMAELQVFWVPTAFSMKAYSQVLAHGSLESEVASRNLEHQIQQITYARELGTPLVIGTDSGGLGINHGESFAEELALLMEAGYATEEAVRCATLNGARLLGLEDELGQLAAGMPATFVVIEGDPTNLLNSLRRPVGVYIRGKAHSLVKDPDRQSTA